MPPQITPANVLAAPSMIPCPIWIVIIVLLSVTTLVTLYLLDLRRLHPLHHRGCGGRVIFGRCTTCNLRVPIQDWVGVNLRK